MNLYATTRCPSHRFEIGLKLQLYGVALTMSLLVFSGLHAAYSLGST